MRTPHTMGAITTVYIYGTFGIGCNICSSLNQEDVEFDETTTEKRYHTAFRSLYRHVVCNVAVSYKVNGDRNQLGRG